LKVILHGIPDGKPDSVKVTVSSVVGALTVRVKDADWDTPPLVAVTVSK